MSTHTTTMPAVISSPERHPPAKRELDADGASEQPKPAQPPAEPRRPSLATLSCIDEDQPGITFNLIGDKKRSHVSPKDAASLCLWALMPLEHPLCGESPRWCFLRHKRRVKHCLVVHVDGLSFETVTHHAWRPADQSPLTADDDAAAPPAPQNTWLQALRRLGPEVQFCPLWVNSTTGRLDVDFFLRQDRSHKIRSGGSAAPAAAPVATPPPVAGEQPAPKSTTKKPTTALAWALQVACRPAATPEEAGTTLQERLLKSCTNTAASSDSAAGETGESSSSNGRISAEVQAAWDLPAERLAEFAMTAQDLLDHGFTLDDPSFLPLLDAPVAPSSASSSPAPPPLSEPAAGDGSDGVRPEFAVAIDCEMVLGANNRSMLARVSVVRVPTGDVLYDTVVLPTEPVVDHVTRYSGITPEMLSAATVTFAEAQAHVRKLVSRETFVIGHGLENDFQALQLLPRSDAPRVIDTTHLFPHTNGLPNKNALRYLAHGFLNGRKIQTGFDGHDSVEDASVCIELIALKLKHGVQFGMPPRVNITQLLSTPMPRPAGAAGEGGSDSSGAVAWVPPQMHLVDRHDVVRRVASRAVSAVFCKTDDEATRKTVSILLKVSSYGGSAAAPGCFVYTTLREVTAAAAAADGEDVGDLPSPPPPADDVSATSPSDVLNSRLAKLINAAPVHTLILVLAAMCPTETSVNRHSSAHGTLWALVKQEGHGVLSETPKSYAPAQASTPASQCAQA